MNGYKAKSKDFEPEIPNDFFMNSIHNGPINDKILPNFKFYDESKQMTGESLFNKHRNSIDNFIGFNILQSNQNMDYNYKGTYYY